MAKKLYTRLKFGELYEKNAPGSYMYSSKRRDYFYNQWTNSLFIVDPTQKNIDKEPAMVYFSFEDLFTKAAYRLSHAKNKASFIIIHGMLSSDMFNDRLCYGYKRLDGKEDFTLLTVTPSFYISVENDDMDAAIEHLYARRVNPRNDIYIVIDSLEEANLKKLPQFIKEGKDKRVYFLILVADENKLKEVYSEEDINTIYSHCDLKYYCNNDTILYVEYPNPKSRKQVSRIKIKKYYNHKKS